MRIIDMVLIDEKTNEIVHRSIDISVIAIHAQGDYFPGPEKQRVLLQQWCNERGNQQHNTILTIKSWEIRHRIPRIS